MSGEPEYHRYEPPEGVIELRVHGVSGTPPVSMLHTPAVRVAGDAASGFYRPAADPDGSRLEAYSWGGMTSGSRVNALWVLLLPFALINAAGWMWRRHGETGQLPTVPHVLIMRLVALGSSGLLTLILTALFVDVAAHRRVWNVLPSLEGGWRYGIGVAAAASAISIVWPVIWWRANGSTGSPDTDTHDPVRRDRITAYERGTAGRLWNARSAVHALNGIHLGFSLGLLVTTVAFGVSDFDEWHTPALILGVAGAGLMVSAASSLLRMTLRPASAGPISRAYRSRGAWLVRALPPLAAVVLAIAAGNGLDSAEGTFPGLTTAFTLTIAAVVILVVGLIVGGLLAGRGLSLGLPGPSATFTIIGLGMLLSLGAGVARLVAGGSTYSESFLADHLAVAFTVTLAIAVALACLVALRSRHPRSTEERRLATSVSVPTSLLILERMARRLGLVLPAAALPLLWLFTLFTLSRAGACDVAWLACPAVELAWGIAMPATDPSWSWLFTAASAVTLAGPVLTVGIYLVRGSGSEAVRRKVGIIWDLVTYWPALYHPWAPPAYPDRAVDDLVTRIEELSTSQSVILSAHSQGTMLTLPVIAALHGSRAMPRIGLLTHGSPIVRHYQRFFPGVVDDQVLEFTRLELTHDGRPRWVNLYRGTDPIAGPIGLGEHDVLVPEPLPDDPYVPPGRRGTVAGHLTYEYSPSYLAGIEDLT